MKLSAGKYYGETSRTFSTAGLTFTEQSYGSYSKLPAHAHELPHFCLVLAGRYNERIGSRSFERNPTALVYYPPDVSHAEEHFRNGRHFIVEMGLGVLESVQNYGAKLDSHVLLSSQPTFELTMKMYGEFRNRDELSGLALQSLSTELLISASREQVGSGEPEPPRWLRRIKEYLDERYCESPGLSELAALAEVHPTHLARVFRKFERCTAGDYLRSVRIRKARKKLIDADTPLVQIALETGFSDQAHFSRSFKRETGITPSEFRRRFRER